MNNVEYRVLHRGDEALLLDLLDQYVDSSLILLSNLQLRGFDYSGQRFEGIWVGAVHAGRLLSIAAHFWNDIIA